jgi:hypothetical protein
MNEHEGNFKLFAITHSGYITFELASFGLVSFEGEALHHNGKWDSFSEIARKHSDWENERWVDWFVARHDIHPNDIQRNDTPQNIQ